VATIGIKLIPHLVKVTQVVQKLKWGTQTCIDIMVVFLPLLQKEGRLNGEQCEGRMCWRKSAPFYLQF